MNLVFPTQKPHNFSAGPAILPKEVFEQAAEAVINFQGKGLSLLEMSHRDKSFVAVMEEARSLVLELLGLSSEHYTVLFLQGGASSQFYQIPFAFLNKGDTASYINTGTWANNAVKEAKLFGNVEEIASSKDSNYNYIPKAGTPSAQSKYIHFTSNNTIFGTQVQQFSEFEWWKSGIPKVCDMSSDIFSKEINASEFDIIYAGAQKNLGPAGTTLVIMKMEGMPLANRNIPNMLNYFNHMSKDSMLNTPPVFAVYVSLLTLRWIKAKGGLSAMQKHNEGKASLLYQYLDQSSLFKGTAAKEDRSRMNPTFVCDEKFEAEFLSTCTEQQISGIKGHRSVGGFRASMYNAMEQSSVEHLVAVMSEFERTKG